MKLSRTFGVKSTDIELGRRWAEEVTGIKATARENQSLGGDYYAFGTYLKADYLILVHNRDVYDDEPVVSGVDEWPIALCLDATTEDSPLLAKLRAATQYFVESPAR